MRMGALGSAVGAPGASEMLDYGKSLAQYDPRIATSTEAAKSTVAVDMAQIQDAQAQGNTALARLCSRSCDRMSVCCTSHPCRVRRLESGSMAVSRPSIRTKAYRPSGVSRASFPVPHRPRGQLAAAESIGKAAGETADVTDLQGNRYTVPKSLLLGGGRGVTPSGTGTSGASGGNPAGIAPKAGSGTPFPMASVGPSTATMLAGNAQNAVEANKEYQSQADAGQQMLAQTAELRRSAADFTPSAFAGTRQKMLEYLNATGLTTDAQNKSLAAAQAGTKIAVQLQAAATKALGSREARPGVHQHG